MAQPLSFADWEKQIASDYMRGGYVSGGPMDPAVGNTLQQLLEKMNNQAPALQQFYDKGLTPEQVLFGQSGKPTGPTPLDPVTYSVDPNTGETIQNNPGATPWGNDPTLTNMSMLFNPNKLNDPNKLFYDPSSGVRSPPSNQKVGGWDKFGDILPYLIMAGITAGAGAAIGTVGGAAGGFFGPGNLLSSTGKSGSFLDTLTSGNSGGAPTAPTTTTTRPNASTMAPLLAILAILSRFGKKG